MVIRAIEIVKLIEVVETDDEYAASDIRLSFRFPQLISRFHHSWLLALRRTTHSFYHLMTDIAILPKDSPL